MGVGVVLMLVLWLAASCAVALVLARAVRLADAHVPEVPRATLRLPQPRTPSPGHQPQEPGRSLADAAVGPPDA